MAELILDVHLEFDPVALALAYNPTQMIAEACRAAAEAQCVERRATLRHPDPRDVMTRRALAPLTGIDVLLVATRWVADSDGVG